MKQFPRGFSFTTMFFGPFPVLFRGDWQMALVLVAIWLFTMVPVIGILGWPLMFLAPAMVNRVYEERATTGITALFPLHPGEARNAIIYCLACTLVGVVIGCSAAMALSA